MNVLTRIQNWGDTHHPKWLDYFRVALGIVLLWKGIAFIINLNALSSLVTHAGLGASIEVSLIAHLIIAFHLLGGICIIMGANTRLFCLLNLPVLVGAVFLVNLQFTLFRPYTELWLSVFVLLALVCFLIEGDGVLFISEEAAKQ